MNQETFTLTENLKMGVATAATHIEGGEQNHNWYRWSELGKIKDGTHSKQACDHINRIEEDVALIADLNVQTYRMGLEWSRIEPEEGKFSQEGISVYIKEIRLLLDRGIQPLVTFWHFSNPLWMEDDGGWTNPKSVNRFLNYMSFVLEQLGDLVTDWITINEPNVYLFFAYFEGIWPPGRQGDIRGFLKGARHLCVSHVKAYELIHSFYKTKGITPKVGVAHHLRAFDGVDKSLLTKLSVKLTERIFQNIFLDAMTVGKFSFPLTKGDFDIKTGAFADFLGVNYYSRDMIKGVWKPGQLFGDRSVAEGSIINDLGWEIYPEGLTRLCTEVYKKYQLPIFITENGTCDANDDFRAVFIYDHLSALTKAQKEEGVTIERYYHWSLLDNFEWAEGNSARFGLYHTDYETQVRTLRKSGAYFRDICSTRIVSSPQ
jgi:beta-glucosidase